MRLLLQSNAAQLRQIRGMSLRRMQRLQGRKSADSKDSETLPLQEQAACDPSALTRSGALQAQSLSRVGRDAQVARLRQEVSTSFQDRS